MKTFYEGQTTNELHTLSVYVFMNLLLSECVQQQRCNTTYNSGGGSSVDSLIGNLSPLDEKMAFICGKKRAKLLVPRLGGGTLLLMTSSKEVLFVGNLFSFVGLSV